MRIAINREDNNFSMLGVKSEDLAQPASKADELIGWLELDLPSNKQNCTVIKKPKEIGELKEEDQIEKEEIESSSESNR